MITVMREWRNTTILRFLPVRVQVCRRNAMVTADWSSSSEAYLRCRDYVRPRRSSRAVNRTVGYIYTHVPSTLGEVEIYTYKYLWKGRRLNYHSDIHGQCKLY